MKTLRHKLMRKSRRVLSLLSILFIVSMGIIPVFISYAISDEENATSKDKTEILWENDTEVGDFDFEEPDEVESYKNYDWGDKTFSDSDSVVNDNESGREDIKNEEINLVEDPQKEVKLAVAAALTGVLGMSAIGGMKAKRAFNDQGGLKVSEEDQSRILDMINKASKKQYTFDEDGYLVFDEESPYNEKGSATYSKLIDAVIESDRDITVGIGSSYNTVGGERKFEGDNQGVSVGDNRTDQVVVLSGLASPLKDVEGNEIYGGAELTLAHELAHAVRGAYGLRNEDLTDDEVNEDEEAAAIGFENKVRYELGYGLRGDGSTRSDVNKDGIADGDGSYGEYTEASDDWFDNIEINESAILTGSLFNFRRSKKKRDKDRARRKRDKREKRKRIRKSKSRLDKIKRDIKKKNSSKKKKKKKKSSSRNKRPSTSSSSSKSNKKDPRTDQLDNAVKNWDKKDKNYNSAVKLYEKAKKDLLSAKSNSDRSNALSRLDGLNKYFSKKDDEKAKPSSSTKKEEKKKEEKKKEEKKTTQTNSTTQGNTNTSNAEPMTDKSEVINGPDVGYVIDVRLEDQENPEGGSTEGNDETVEYILADDVREKLIKDGLVVHMETDGYDAGKVIEDVITNFYEYKVGNYAVSIAKELVPQSVKFVSGVGYVLTAKEALDIAEEIRLTSVMKKHGGVKIESYTYYDDTIMDTAEDSSAVVHHVYKDALLITNIVDDKEVVVGFISSGLAVEVRTGSFIDKDHPANTVQQLDITGNYISNYVTD